MNVKVIKSLFSKMLKNRDFQLLQCHYGGNFLMIAYDITHHKQSF